MKTAKELVEWLNELEKDATPSPWRYDVSFGKFEILGPGGKSTHFNAVAGHYGIDVEDAELMVAARNALPSLLEVFSAAISLREALGRPHPPDCSCGDEEFKKLCTALDAVGATS